MTLVLVDTAHTYCRAKYTTGMSLTNGALFGYCRMSMAIEREMGASPVHCLEGGGAVLRAAVLPEYKSDRPPGGVFEPGHLRAIVDFATLMGHSVAWAEGCEADDIIATMARYGDAETVICSGDHDLRAVLEDGRVVIRKDLKSDPYTEADLYAEYEVAPRDYWKMRALCGDSSDSVPGIRGIGEKTAAKIGKEAGWDFEKMLKHDRVKDHVLQCRTAARVLVLRDARSRMQEIKGVKDEAGLEAFYDFWQFHSLKTGKPWP